MPEGSPEREGGTTLLEGRTLFEEEGAREGGRCLKRGQSARAGLLAPESGQMLGI